MKVISWNVNGLRSRMEQVLLLLQQEEPTLLLLQEIKWADAKVGNSDYEAFRSRLYDLGYNCYAGSVTSNHGVMTVYHTEDESKIDLITGHSLPVDRVLVIGYGTSLIINVYVNQGQALDSPEYPIKINLIHNLHNFICNMDYSGIIVGGDFNICPEDSHVWSTKHWHSEVISRTETEIISMKAMCEVLGLVNSDIVADPDKWHFSWYGYRQWRWKVDNEGQFKDDGKYGIKPDHLMSNIPAISHSTHIGYRLLESPSDHVPIEAIYNYQR